MKIHFYVGAMESDHMTVFGQREEVHVLTQLDFVLTANSEKEAKIIDALLRAANKEFIRSDNKMRTFVELHILNQLEVQS